MDRAAHLDATSELASESERRRVGPTREDAQLAAAMPPAAAKSRGSRFAMTPLLAFSCFALLVGDLLFGYDTASFGGLLANPVGDRCPRPC